MIKKRVLFQINFLSSRLFSRSDPTRQKIASSKSVCCLSYEYQSYSVLPMDPGIPAHSEFKLTFHCPLPELFFRLQTGADAGLFILILFPPPTPKNARAQPFPNACRPYGYLYIYI
jgi:hypothetical protein